MKPRTKALKRILKSIKDKEYSCGNCRECNSIKEEISKSLEELENIIRCDIE